MRTRGDIATMQDEKGVITIAPLKPRPVGDGTIANGRKGGYSEEPLLAPVYRTPTQHFDAIQSKLTSAGTIALNLPNSIERQELLSCVTIINTELHYLREKAD